MRGSSITKTRNECDNRRAPAAFSFAAYLSGWHDMQEQITDDRTRARRLLHISQEVIKLKLRVDEEFSRCPTFFNESCLQPSSLSELKQRISHEFNRERDYRQVSHACERLIRSASLAFLLSPLRTEIGFAPCRYSSRGRTSKRISHGASRWSIIIERRRISRQQPSHARTTRAQVGNSDF